jgi:hypothetical protein
MLRSRPIRIAVNLCLTGALLFSNGGFSPAIASVCETTASSSAHCSGCGHCLVEHPGAPCGCCSRQQHQLAAKQKVARPKSCCHPSPAAAQTGSPSNVAKVNACHCGHGPQPAAPTSQDRVEVEQILKLAPQPICSPLSGADQTALAAVLRQSHTQFRLPHASQQLLCIWRI